MKSIILTVIALSLCLANLTCDGGSGGDEGVEDVSGQETAGGDKCLKFELLSGNHQPPSNIVVLFGLETCDGQPKPGIKAKEFVIKEDGKVISQYESGQAILPSEMGFKMAAVLLLDMSGSIIASGNLEPLKDAAVQFVNKLESTHDVFVFTFDGRKQLLPLPAGGDAGVSAIKALSFPECTSSAECPEELPVCHKAANAGYCVGDPSTNLNGAVEEGLSFLDELKGQVTGTTTFAGSLVVFTDGTDQAGIVSDSSAVSSVNSSGHTVFSIGLGGEVDQSQLDGLGKDGSRIAEDAEQMSSAFDEIAKTIEERSKRFYIVGYCSPKRAGSHELTLEVDGFSGSLSYEFDADQFEAGCDASAIADPCGDKECGTGEMGLLCGTCKAGVSCVNGQCETCVPSCFTAEGSIAECGDDGCGGSCGQCGAGKVCMESCTVVGALPTLSSEELEFLADLGFPVYDGQSPPNIGGTYLVDSWEIVQSSFLQSFDDYHLQYWVDPSSGYPSYATWDVGAEDWSSAKLGYLTGHQNCYTIMYDSTDWGSPCNVSLISGQSGCFEGDDIVGYRTFALVRSADLNDDPCDWGLTSGDYLAAKESDGLCEKIEL